MASGTETDPPPFTFILEYMASSMVIKTLRPATYSILRLCNIAALVLQKKESPVIHNFHPKAVLPWANRVIDVKTDEMLHKVIQVCKSKGEYILHLTIMFDDQPPYGRTDQHVLTRLLATGVELTAGGEPLMDDAVAQAGEQSRRPTSQVVGVKRTYRCKLCKAEGHGKRTCKIVKPTPTMGPFNKNDLGGENCNRPDETDRPTNDETVQGTRQFTI